MLTWLYVNPVFRPIHNSEFATDTNICLIISQIWFYKTVVNQPKQRINQNPHHKVKLVFISTIFIRCLTVRRLMIKFNLLC